ncbi:MAG: glycosidase [Oscillospiraceae bacterium]|jgi:sucrose phosphorylase|nr:glycosidase [Oscillospiraceae bacterium]
MNDGTMLNAYPDSLGGTLKDIADFLESPACRDAFRSAYVLPSLFHTDLDRGFSVISYDLDRRLADPESLDRIRAAGIDLKLDFILNHLSVLSPQFQDLLQKGDASPYRDFFIHWNDFWAGHGAMIAEGYIQPDAEYLREMFTRKPGLPLLMVRFPDGRDVPYWNTFYQAVRYDAPDTQDWMRLLGLQYGEAAELAALVNAALERGETPAQMALGRYASQHAQVAEALESRRKYLGQMDLNLQSERVWDYYDQTLKTLAGYGAAIVRLDAFAYAPKAPGRRNFMNEPETWEVLERVRQLADGYGLTLLPEIHAAYAEGIHETLAQKGYMTYDFFLPGLLIDALEGGDAAALVGWIQELRGKGIRTVNMLGCHDGIPLLDLKGLIPDVRIQALIDLIVSRGGLVKNLHGQKNVYYQVNATYYSALGEDDRKMLLARALQLFMPGKPQVWYLDLFGGRNDLAAAARGGAAGHKEINRTNLTAAQVAEGLQRPLVQNQLKLLRMRNRCPAFAADARLIVEQKAPHAISLRWEKGGASAVLEADLRSMAFSVHADWPGEVFAFAQ